MQAIQKPPWPLDLRLAGPRIYGGLEQGGLGWVMAAKT